LKQQAIFVPAGAYSFTIYKMAENKGNRKLSKGSKLYMTRRGTHNKKNVRTERKKEAGRERKDEVWGKKR
jgi:hypothetical protein